MMGAELYWKARPTDRCAKCSWYIIESGERWTTAAFRFAPGVIPAGHQISVESSTEPNSVFLGQANAEIHLESSCHIVIWQITRSNLIKRVDQLVSVRTRRQGYLHIAAIDQLGRDDLLCLSELGIAACIRHPEDLAKLIGPIRGHFARFADSLD